MKKWIVTSVVFCLSTYLFGQTAAPAFIDFQKNFPVPGDAMKRKLDTLQKQFAVKGLKWPAKYIYIRSFKYDSQLEVWVKNELKEPFKLFKTYKVCALAGTLGPKRMEGDYQVPEGFYYINEFNPRSNYHLALGINYPNASDRLLSDSLRPGGDIYIHGSCVTVGCIPVMDSQIEELYILAAYAKDQGQDFIPVHIFPIRYNNKRSADYLASLTKNDGQLKVFAERLEEVFDHFEATRELPVIMTGSKGDYVFSGLKKRAAPVAKQKKAPVQHLIRNISQLPGAVQVWPKFSGGNENFLKYLDKTGKSLVPLLPHGTKKAYVVVEFIVDSDGTPVNFKLVKGVNDEFDDELISILEKMPPWQPALLNDKPTAWKMKQGFAIEE